MLKGTIKRKERVAKRPPGKHRQRKKTFSASGCSSYLWIPMKKQIHILVLFLVVAMLVPHLSGEGARAEGAPENPPGKVTATLDRDSAKVGAMVELSLKIELPQGEQLPEDSEIGGLEGLTALGRVRLPDEIRIRLLVDRIGPWQSGPITLTFRDKNKKIRILEAAPVSLTVFSNLGDHPSEASLRPIQDIIPGESSWVRFLPWLLGVFGVLAAAFAAFWWWRKRRIPDMVPTVEEPPHIRALREVEELNTRGLFERGEAKSFYFALSEILRRYLESIRHFPAAEFTTEEISQHLHKEEDRTLLPLLRQTDLVKFADFVPTHARKEEDISRAFAYIRATGPAAEGELAMNPGREGRP